MVEEYNVLCMLQNQTPSSKTIVISSSLYYGQNSFKCSSCVLKQNSTMYRVHSTTKVLESCRSTQQPYKVYSSKVTKLIVAIRSRELTTMAPLAVPTVLRVVGVSIVVGVPPRTSGRWQQGTGWLFGLQVSGV